MRTWPNGQRGVVAVLVAMLIVVMVGLVGLAIDLGRLFVAKTELQNAADACALAAVDDMRAVNSRPTELAVASGRTVANLHRVGFQGHALSTASTPVTITFSTTVSGPFVSGLGLSSTQAAAMKYVRCEVGSTGIKTIFIQVLNVLPGVNIGDQSVRASAVGTLLPSRSACPIPIAMCSADAIPAKVGQWFAGPLQPSRDDGLSAGNFGWVDLTPGGKGTADIGSQLLSDGVCNAPDVGTTVSVAGNRTSLAAQYNSRFGIYFGSVKVGDAAPDQSGYSYTNQTWWDLTANPKRVNNAFSDFAARRTRHEPYQGDAVTGLTTMSTGQPSSYLQANGRDRRVVIIPIVDCNARARLTRTAEITAWGCAFLLHPMNANTPDTSTSGGGAGSDISKCFDGANASKVCVEYRGAANAANSPCGSYGIPAAPTSRGARVPALAR